MNLNEFSVDQLKAELEKREASAARRKSMEPDANYGMDANWVKMSEYGTWEVTTEGDCEGRTTKNLGTYEGNLSDIAFALADQCYYSLHFTPARILKPVIKNGPQEVNIQLSIDSRTWDQERERRAVNVGAWLQKDGNPKIDFTAEPSNYYASVKLVRR